jgi:hypothetical protein
VRLTERRAELVCEPRSQHHAGFRFPPAADTLDTFRQVMPLIAGRRRRVVARLIGWWWQRRRTRRQVAGHLVAARVYALRIGQVIALLHAPLRIRRRAGTNRRTAHRAGAGANGRAAAAAHRSAEAGPQQCGNQRGSYFDCVTFL